MSLGLTLKYRSLISCIIIFLLCILVHYFLVPSWGFAQAGEVYRVKRSGERSKFDKAINNPKINTLEPAEQYIIPDSQNPAETVPSENIPNNTQENASNNSLETPSMPSGFNPMFETERDLLNAAKLYQWQQISPKEKFENKRPLASPNAINHVVFEELLEKFVSKSGWVKYRELKKDKEAREALQAYIEDLSQLDPSSLEDPKDRMASWLNLYNALVIQEVLEHYPIKSVLKVRDFFAKQKFLIGDKKYSFIDIEQEVFLKQIADPRCVFARVNGAVSGGKMQRAAFSAAKVDAQLEEITWKYLSDPKNVRYDSRTRSLYLNQSFLLFAKEFINVDEFLRAYLDLLPAKVSYQFGSYDWTLNDARLH